MEAPKLIDVADVPGILRLVREVARTGVPVILGQGDEKLAVLMPASAPSQDSEGLQDTDDEDSLLKIIGIGESMDPTDISRHKQEYLAQAFDLPNR